MTSARLPDGRSLSIAAGIADRVSCGALVLDGVDAGDPAPLAAETAALAAELRERHAGREAGFRSPRYPQPRKTASQLKIGINAHYRLLTKGGEEYYFCLQCE